MTESAGVGHSDGTTGDAVRLAVGAVVETTRFAGAGAGFRPFACVRSGGPKVCPTLAALVAVAVGVLGALEVPECEAGPACFMAESYPASRPTLKTNATATASRRGLNTVRVCRSGLPRTFEMLEEGLATWASRCPFCSETRVAVAVVLCVETDSVDPLARQDEEGNVESDCRQFPTVLAGRVRLMDVPFDGIIERYLLASTGFERTLRTVEAAEWTCRTPCTDWDVLPPGEGLGATGLAVRTADTAIHTWDLARAVAGDEQLDTSLVAWIYDNVQEMVGSPDAPSSARSACCCRRLTEAGRRGATEGTVGWGPAIYGTGMEIFDSLEAEYDQLDGILAGLSAKEWSQPSAAAGWTNVDVLLHLAQSEEAVVSTLTGPAVGPAGPPMVQGRSVDEAMGELVAAERAGPDVVYPRWQAARVESVRALRLAAPSRVSAWVSAPLRPATLATTRLAEHWAHALDIAVPLSIPYPDTARLRHIAWLGHRTLPYAFRLAGMNPEPIRVELTGPDGDVWQLGPADADSVISGSAGAFCRVGARRLAPDRSGLTATGPHAATALTLLRNFAA